MKINYTHLWYFIFLVMFVIGIIFIAYINPIQDKDNNTYKISSTDYRYGYFGVLLIFISIFGGVGVYKIPELFQKRDVVVPITFDKI